MKQFKCGIRLESEYKNKLLTPWLDTGFNGTLVVNESLAEKLLLRAGKIAGIQLGDGKTTIGKYAYGDIRLFLDNKDILLRNCKVLVLKNEPEPLIGYEFLEKLNSVCSLQAKLDPIEGKIKYC